MNSTVVRDVVALVARIGLGVVFIAHGWQKLNTFGLDGAAASFEMMNVPLPTASAYFATFVELVGGGALVLGIFTPIAGLLLFLNMLGAAIFVHFENGVFATENGYELVVALGVGALLLAAFGAGRISIDGLTKGKTALGA
ncbi:DoxX family protein [Rhodococcus sp. ARC_M12]|uniref:DoxX family protein n=1 Tax=Rhodococcus navarretei TaxID=3128981 RepID=A0ABU9CZB8_9NOCA|nr:DoxX family protein [Rhodococcus sp. ARC_M12]MCJ0976774.1 DoxX family protein [Rhodococcus sp. ARC_M12]